MGRGEDYGMEFREWFTSKDSQSKALYVSENPEPEEWAGFYGRLSDS